jgi:heme/copper-type cytochrome/quinol oxidase subunit 4
MNSKEKKSRDYLHGIITFVVLAALTAGEFWVSSVTNGSVVFLLIIAVIKAAIILQYFMHISHVWSEETHS